MNSLHTSPTFFCRTPLTACVSILLAVLCLSHCHGNSAYPGKAPKLKPSSYQPDFVYDRVTNGFRKMPGWKAVFYEKPRVGVVAYIMSSVFEP